ncbi:MAG: DUF1700 domain-containing protein [Lachnospiraceae bacterium]|nr:DUF1700 domain-containing protein [Lachnospiraceae bacterium]
MTKAEFMADLRNKLSGLSQDDMEDRLAFYDEMIDDYIEHGVTEEEAVARLGESDEIVSLVVSEIPLRKIVKEKIKPPRSGKAGKIGLLILLFPIWFPILVTVIALSFAFYVVLWAIEIALFAVVLAFVATVFLGLISGIYFFIQGNAGAGTFMTGCGIIGAGLTLITFFLCILMTKGIFGITKGFFHWVKSWFIGKEVQHA